MIMKTNQVLTRKMGEFDVYQRTSDGMFSATTLMNQWNCGNGQKKNINHFFENSATKEFVDTITKRESDIRNSESPSFKAFIKTKCKTNSDGSKIPGEVWMCPLLFIDFAMWINPSFKYDVLKFVYDQLIKYRNDAGDAYKDMSAQIHGISPDGVPFKDIIKGVSRAINIVVYGRHESMIRNKIGDENKARELFEIERDVAKMIKRGFIKTLVELRQFLLAEYRERHEPKLMEI